MFNKASGKGEFCIISCLHASGEEPYRTAALATNLHAYSHYFVPLKERGRRLPPTKEDFQEELDRILLSTRWQGVPYIDVESGYLHQQAGHYPDRNHRMPVCCRVMKSNMKEGDRILQQPPSGHGASLIIRYRLPR